MESQAGKPEAVGNVFLEKNLTALARESRNQEVLTQLQETLPATDVELYETDSGDYTLLYQGVLLHHSAGAVQEARQICNLERNLFHPGLRTNHIILGIGLGYLLDEVFQQSQGRLYVFEPDLPLLRFVLENVDLAHILGSGRLYLASSLDMLFTQLKRRYVWGEEIDVLVTTGYAQRLPQEIRMLGDRLLSVVQEQRDNIGIGLTYHLDWVRHFFQNLSHFPRTVSFDRYLNCFAGKPALVISSGPSLDQALPAIKASQDKMVLIAVGGALRPLLAQGVIPDFAAFLDFSGPKEQLTNLPGTTEMVRFLLGPFVDGAAYTAPAADQILVSLDNYPSFADWLDKVSGQPSYRVPAGSTVSMMALECAKAMGCDPLILVGQDLALKDNRYYAGGVEAQVDAEGYVSLEASDTMVARRMKLLEIPGQEGEILKTTPDFFAYRDHLQDFARYNAQAPEPRRLFNASVGGALIEGFTHQPLASILQILNLPVLDKTSCLSMVIARGDSQAALSPAALADEAQALLTGLRNVAASARAVLPPLSNILDGIEPERLEETLPDLERRQGERYRLARNAFSELLNRYPLVEYCLKKEVWELQSSFIFEPKTTADYHQNLLCDQKYFAGIVQRVESDLIPWLSQAIEAIHSFSSPTAFSGRPV